MKYAIFLNGVYPEFNMKHFEILKDRIIYCADGGANVLYKYKLMPEMILGDLDSVKTEVLKYYEDNGVEIKKYSQDKDYTDFGIVLLHIYNQSDEYMHNRFEEQRDEFISELDIVVFGATGKRVDMTLSNLKLLEKNKNMKYITEVNEIVRYIDTDTTIENEKGKLFSIIPITNIEKLTLKGFRYNLENKDVSRSIGLASNVIEDDKVSIEFEKGEMYIFLEI